MSESNRKPIVVAILCAAVALLIWVMGVGFGGGGNAGGGGDWQEKLSDVGKSQTLALQDLRLVEGSCGKSELSVTVQGTCTFTVEEFGGSFDLGPSTKEATIAVRSGAMKLVAQIEGVSAAQDLGAGDESLLTFGTSGGSLTVLCASISCTFVLTNP